MGDNSRILITYVAVYHIGALHPFTLHTHTIAHTHVYYTHAPTNAYTCAHVLTHTAHTLIHTHVDIKNLYTKVEELEHLNTSLQERLSLSLPTSPTLHSGDLNTSSLVNPSFHPYHCVLFTPIQMMSLAASWQWLVVCNILLSCGKSISHHFQ